MNKSLSYLILIVSTLLSCTEEPDQPEEVTPSVSSIQLNVSATSYYVGEDDHSIMLNAVALDKAG